MKKEIFVKIPPNSRKTGAAKIAAFHKIAAIRKVK
jgi:hypothetical protein